MKKAYRVKWWEEDAPYSAAFITQTDFKKLFHLAKYGKNKRIRKKNQKRFLTVTNKRLKRIGMPTVKTELFRGSGCVYVL